MFSVWWGMCMQSFKTLKKQYERLVKADYNEIHTADDIDRYIENTPHSSRVATILLRNHPLLNAQHIDKIVEKDPWAAAEYLRNHKDFNAQHIDKIIEKDPDAAAEYLNNHKDFNAQHIDKLIEKDPEAAVEYLRNHKDFNAQHIDKIIEKDSRTAAKKLHDHKNFNPQHIDKIVEKNQWVAAIYLRNHPLFNAQHIDKIVEKEPRAAAYLHDHPLLSDQHIDKIIEKDPEAAAKYFGIHPYYMKKYGDKKRLNFSSNTEKLRKLRDLAEESGGIIHSKRLAHYGLHENSLNITHLKDSKGNYSVQAIQNHIDSLPKHSYSFSRTEWNGPQRHSKKTQNVFQLNITPEIIEKLQNEGVYDTFKAAHKLIFSENHPVKPETLGWVRYNKAGDQYHIDEIQTDFGHNTLSRIGQDNPLLSQDKLKKMHDVLFSGQNPSKLIHEAFLQHMRNKGKAGSQIHMWQAKPKAKLAKQDISKELPVHMKVGYQEVPPKLDYSEGAYGEIKPQTNSKLQNQPTWKTTLRKSLKYLTKEYERLVKTQKPFVQLNPEHGKQIANAYESMQHDPNDPDVKAAYDALINETKQQYSNLLAGGLKVSKMQHGMENPYPTSKHLHADVEQNHMWYYPTEAGFGSSETSFQDHPMLQPTEFKDAEGKPMLANDVFRVVHDGIHAKLKNSFGPKGEHEAYLEHKKMFSPLAQKALATETMGQNSWVNFGPHAEHNRKNPANTIYADQKAGLLPDDVINGKWHQ